MDSKERVNSQLKQLLDQVRKEPTHLNYWNVYKLIQKLDLDALEVPKEKRISVALLSSFTIDPLAIYVDVKSRLAHLHPEIYVAPFNQYQQEILDKNSRLYEFKPDVIILAVQTDVLVNENFISEYVKLSDVEQTQIEILNRFQAILHANRQDGRSCVGKQLYGSIIHAFRNLREQSRQRIPKLLQQT